MYSKNLIGLKDNITVTPLDIWLVCGCDYYIQLNLTPLHMTIMDIGNYLSRFCGNYSKLL